MLYKPFIFPNGVAVFALDLLTFESRLIRETPVRLVSYEHSHHRCTPTNNSFAMVSCGENFPSQATGSV